MSNEEQELSQAIEEFIAEGCPNHGCQTCTTTGAPHHSRRRIRDVASRRV